MLLDYYLTKKTLMSYLKARVHGQTYGLPALNSHATQQECDFDDIGLRRSVIQRNKSAKTCYIHRRTCPPQHDWSSICGVYAAIKHEPGLKLWRGFS